MDRVRRKVKATVNLRIVRIILERCDRIIKEIKEVKVEKKKATKTAGLRKARICSREMR